MQPLQSVRVLDLSRLLPGPFCTLVLSDLGAQVDKVEDPFVGDYLRLFPPLAAGQGGAPGLSGRFVALNRDKRSLCLDLKKPAGKEALLRLVSHYQVLVESFRPGVMDRLSLSCETLWQHNPALVVCSISGYGQTGPYKDRAGHDLNYAALSGVLSLCGAKVADPPHPLPIQLADLGAGGLWAAIGILAALRKAEQTGQGSHIDLSMCEGTTSFLLPEFGNRFARDEEGEAGGSGNGNQNGTAEGTGRGEDTLTGGVACYGVYRTADGGFLSVGALEPKFWANLCHVLGRQGDPSELVAPPAEQERLREELQAIFLKKTRAEWEALFAQADACVEPVLSPEEVVTHPLHVARKLVFDGRKETGEAPLWQVRTPLRPVDQPCERPPVLGQHSRAILTEAGFSEAEINALFAQNIAR